MLGRRLTENEFSHAYGLLFQESGSVHECLVRVRNLDQRSLKQAYRRRAQETHPDRAHLRAATSVDSETEFRSVVAAYELLKLVQQGAVDVHLVTRQAPSAAANASRRDADSRASQAAAKAAKARQQAEAQARSRSEEARKRSEARQSRSSSAGNGHAADRKTNGSADTQNYQQRSTERAEAWGKFWRNASGAAKFNPNSDHYFEQPIPSRQLPFGQFLYYSGAISWRQLIDALVWQRQQRPMIGQLARSWGILSEEQVHSVLEHRRRSGRYDVKFADFAEELGFLSAQDKLALCGRMKMLQKPLGQYFVETGVFTKVEINERLAAHRRHNWRAMQRRAVS